MSDQDFSASELNKSLSTATLFWAIADGIYGGLLATLSWHFIPRTTAKLPELVWGLSAWGVLHVLLAFLTILSLSLSLKGIQNSIWRCNVTISILTVIFGIILSTLCLTSGLYWLGVFGVLGWGVFISSLLLISGVLQILILYPALKLRRLLSHRFRSSFKGGGIPLRLLKLCLIAMVLSGILGAYHGHISTDNYLSPQERGLITSYLRATLEGAPFTPAQNRVDAQGLLQGPLSSKIAPQKEQDLSSLAYLRSTRQLYVSFYAGGQRIARVSGRGTRLDKSVLDAARALASHPKLIGKRLKGGRLVVDRIIGETIIPLSKVPVIGPVIAALSLDPGVDGLRSRQGGAIRTILPSDLVEDARFGVAPIIPGIPELRFGVDIQALSKRLGPMNKIRLSRIRTEQWVEKLELDGPQQIGDSNPTEKPSEKVALNTRGHWGKELFNQETAPQETLLNQREHYREAAHLGGLYLLNHQNSDGRFDYQYFPFQDHRKQPSDTRYSVPRHAGAIYGLSLLFQDRPLPEYANSAKQAIAWLKKYAISECGGWSKEVVCIPRLSSKAQIATLGNSALSALAILSYMKATNDHSVASLAHGLVSFLAHMQRADGNFYHRYLLYDDSVEPRDRGMFASEQAAFALVLAAQLWPDQNWQAKAEKALDALTTHKYENDFLSSFFYGADHWTCLAAEAAFPMIQKREYLDFCLGYTRFLQRLQYRYELGEGDITYHGHYGFGFLSPPQAPATGGFTEGVMGTLLLAEAHQVASQDLQDIYAQVLASTQALMSDQITKKQRWNIKNYNLSQGAFRRSLVESEIRVDFVQHSLSALLMTQKLRNRVSQH